MRTLVLRHHEEDSAGFVGDAFESRGATLDEHLYPEGGSLPPAESYDSVVVLGAKWSIYDDGEVGGWLPAELEWLRRTDAGGSRILGICFGAQALTAAFGGRVEKAPRPEIGWTFIVPVGDQLIGPGPWFQFHSDRCLLPATARLRAFNDVGPQAFSIGRNLGVQFHPEVDAAQVERWLADGGLEEVEAAGLDPDKLLAEVAAEEEAARERAFGLVDVFLADPGS